MKKIKTLCATLFCLLSMSSCGWRYTNSELTDITMQRVEIDDSVMNGKVMYLLTPIFVGHDWELMMLPSPANWIKGSYEPIDSIIVNNADGNCLNDSIAGLDIKALQRSWGEKTIFDGILLDFVDDAEKCVVVLALEDCMNNKFENLFGGLKKNFMDGGPWRNDSYLIYVEEGQSLPDSIIVEFEHRKLKAKVDNTPKKVKFR